MNKIKELKTTRDNVKSILESDKYARNSDDYLYCMVCKKIDEISVHLPFWKVLSSRKDFKFPSFESVTRARRYLQQKYPELAGDPDVETQRMLNEEIYKEFAKGVI